MDRKTNCYLHKPYSQFGNFSTKLMTLILQCYGTVRLRSFSDDTRSSWRSCMVMRRLSRSCFSVVISSACSTSRWISSSFSNFSLSNSAWFLSLRRGESARTNPVEAPIFPIFSSCRRSMSFSFSSSIMRSAAQAGITSVLFEWMLAAVSRSPVVMFGFEV